MMLRFGLAVVLLGVLKLTQAETTDGKRELSAVQAKIREIGVDVSNLAGEKNAQIEQLKRLEKQYGQQVNALREIKTEIRHKEQSLQDVRTKLTAMQKDIQAQQQGLQGLIKSAYAMGDQQGLNVILSQSDPALSGRMMVYYDYISKARLQKLAAINQDLKSLQQLESQQDTEAQLLQVELEKKQQETDALQALQQQREKLLAQIDQDYALKHGELAQLIRDEKKLEALVASLQKTDDNEPVPTQVTRNQDVAVAEETEVTPAPKPNKVIEPAAEGDEHHRVADEDAGGE